MTIRLTESYLVEVGFSARLVFGPTVSFHLRAGLIWREQLISELEALTDAEALAAWAERVHAELVETAFAAKLGGATAADLTRPGQTAGSARRANRQSWPATAPAVRR
jgi:hypothetical protein